MAEFEDNGLLSKKSRARIFAYRILFFLISFLLLNSILVREIHAKVFIPRLDRMDPFENPQSFDAREIYSGRFKINGVSSEMHILYSQEIPLSTSVRLERADPDHIRLQKSSNNQNIIGMWKSDASEKQFLIRVGVSFLFLMGKRLHFLERNKTSNGLLYSRNWIQINKIN
jgi:hypothetical protein